MNDVFDRRPQQNAQQKHTNCLEYCCETYSLNNHEDDRWNEHHHRSNGVNVREVFKKLVLEHWDSFVLV